MTEIEPLTYNSAWWVAIDLRPEDRRELAVTRDPDDVEALVRDALKSDLKWSAWNDQTPVFAFGATLIDAGKGAHVWGFGNSLAASALIPVTKFIGRVMIPLLVDSGVRYAQAVSHPENKTAHRWLTHLGFKLKASIPGVGSRKEDMLLFTTSANVHKRRPIQLTAA